MGLVKLPLLKILHLEKNCYPPHILQQLEEGNEVHYFDAESQEKLFAFVDGKDFEVVFTRLGLSMDATLINSLTRLQYIVTPTTGLNHIDLNHARQKNVEVISLKGEEEFLKQIASTAEHTWALLLALIRNLPAAYSDVLAGNWRRKPFLASELNGKTLGIVGYGRLGKMVARYGNAFGMKVLACDVNEAVFLQKVVEIHAVAIDQLLSESDVISLHIPSNEVNYHFLDEKKLSQIKPGAVLVNTSRGEVVDESALLEAVRSGVLAGFATDVLEGDSVWDEHAPNMHPLIEYARSNSHVIVTPHMGGYGKNSILKTRALISMKFLEKVKGNYLGG